MTSGFVRVDGGVITDASGMTIGGVPTGSGGYEGRGVTTATA